LHWSATCSIVNTMASTAKVARVAVSDEQWRAFRQAGLAQGISVSTYLARLVETELKRRRGRPVAAVDPEAAPADQAVNGLAEVRASIDELDKIAGRLARSAVAHGASWEDIGSSLRLDGDKARAAYER
jgi:hypothetical protein